LVCAFVGTSVFVALVTIVTIASTNDAGYAQPGFVLLMAAISGAYFILETAETQPQ